MNNSKNNKKKTQLKPVQLQDTPLSQPVLLPYAEALIRLEKNLHAGAYAAVQYQAPQLIEQVPGDVIARFILLKSYIDEGQLAEAGQLVEELERSFPRDARVHKEASRYYLHCGEPDKAIAAIEKGIRLNPIDGYSYFQLGHILSTLSDKEAAVQAFSAAIKINPQIGHAHYGRALLIKDQVPEAYLQQLEKLIARSGSLDPGNRICLYFAAALSYGETQPDKHFEYLQIGNALIVEQNPWNAKGYYDRLVAGREFVARALKEFQFESPNADLEPVFIASMPRSGTTLLEQILGMHSNISPLGESQVFESALKGVSMQLSLSPDTWIWSEADWQSALPLINQLFMANPKVESAGHKRIVDKSINNAEFIGLILLAYPKAKIIHLKRHPLDVVLSCYQIFFDGFQAHLASQENIAYLYQMYDEQMRVWKELFPDNIVTFDYEELVEDKAGVTARLLAFCNLEWEDQCLSHHESTGAILTSSMMQARRPLYKSSIHRWKKFAKYLQPAADILHIDIDA